MKITILAVGTRGDVQPYIALGLGLQNAGHEIRLAGSSNFETFIGEYGLEYARLEGNFREMMEMDAVQMIMEKGNPLLAYREMNAMIQHILECFAADSWQVCQGTDAVIFSTLGVTGYHVAEKLGVPSCWALLQPMSRTRVFPNMVIPVGKYKSGTLNWFSHLIGEQTVWQPARRFINQWRKESLGLKPMPFWGPNGLLIKQHFPMIYGYSPLVLPKPADWGDWLHVTGYWFLDHPDGWQPPAELVGFIGAGKPPVYIGFGSMNNRDAGEMMQIVVEAIQISEQRAIIAAGWGDMVNIDLPDSIYMVDEVPHDWLFPQMSAAVHHGGAGTVAAALRAGIPSIIIPYCMDQPFWGQRVFELGVGHQPIQRAQLNAQLLAAAIAKTVNNREMKESAATLAEKINAEDGVNRAVELITHYLSQ